MSKEAPVLPEADKAKELNPNEVMEQELAMAEEEEEGDEDEEIEGEYDDEEGEEGDDEGELEEIQEPGQGPQEVVVEEEEEEAEEEEPPVDEEEMVEEEDTYEENEDNEADASDEEQEEEEEEEEEDADQDDILNLLMQNQVEDDDINLLFVDQSALEQEVETIANYPGVIGLTLSNETKQFLDIENLEEQEQPYVFISFKRIKLHLYIYGEKSEFFEHYQLFKNYPDFSMLLGYDLVQSTGHPYYLCTTIEARNLVKNPPKKKRASVGTKKKEEEAWNKMASVIPRKWRSLGSEIEVEGENVQYSRPLLTVYAYRDRDKFNNVSAYQDRTPDTNPDDYVAFESTDKSLRPRLECMEIDVAVQVMPQKTTSSTQTGFSFKRNKMVQYEIQALEAEKVTSLIDIPVELVIKKSKPLQRAILQNEMMNLNLDDYKHLKAVKGHEVEYSNESILLQEYQTYCDLRHSKGRYVTSMIFHPTLEDVVVMSMAVDATFDKRIDFHSEMLMEPNFVLFWDLKDPIHPQFMLDAPNDVFSFMINPSDPHLVCGGCANGQVVLWDLGKLHSDLRSRIQNRRTKKATRKDSMKKRPSFLEKLNDTAEKYACPLVPTVGLSNLDQSHKRVVTSVCWLPPHVEIGKNGTLYENTVGGKSVQFFSSAGDGSLRLWDIRAPKAGLEEYDLEPNKDIIKVNPWVHLENNLWKYFSKYQLDDGSGTMFATILSLSEPKIGDVVTIDPLALQKSTSGTSSGDGASNSPRGSKDNLAKSSETLSSMRTKKSFGLNLVPGLGSGEDARGTGSGNLTGGDPDSTRRAAGLFIALPSALTSIFVGTESGQIILVDWLRNKDGTMNMEMGSRVCQNMYMETVHDGAITCIARSPFYNNLILVVGGGTVSIWKESIGYPLLATSGSDYFPWCGCWSNTRPAVFFVGTREGALEAWDLTEKSNAPVLIQQISPGRLTNCAIPKASQATKKQFLAVSDSVGNLFVMLLPRFYCKPTQLENNMMQELMNREEQRITHWQEDAGNRVQRIEAIHSAWKEGRIMKTEEEEKQIEILEEDKLNLEYLDFLEFQTGLVDRLKKEEILFTIQQEDVGGEPTEDDFDELIDEIRDREDELREEGLLVDSNSSISLGSDNNFY